MKYFVLIGLIAFALLLSGCVEQPVCGNGLCEPSENHETCPQDCPLIESHLECQAQACVEVQGPGVDECATDADCLGPNQIKAIGRIEELVEEMPEHNIWRFGAFYVWNHQNNYFHRPQPADSSITLNDTYPGHGYTLYDLKYYNVVVPKDHLFDTDYSENPQRVFYIQTIGTIPSIEADYYADTVNEFDYIWALLPNFYDLCWDYNCFSDYPYSEFAEPLEPVLLTEKEEGHASELVEGIKGPYILAKEEVNLVIVFSYIDNPISEETISILKGEMAGFPDDSSLNYFSDWFPREANKYNHNINITLDFVESQIQIPRGLSYDQLYGNVANQLPQIENYDLMGLYYIDSQTPYEYGGNYRMTENSYISALYDWNSFDQDGKIQRVRWKVVAGAHEFLHLLGAAPQELYTGDGRCKLAGEIYELDPMCGKINSLSEAGISDITAKELGWYDLDGDGIIDIEDPCPYNLQNNC